MRLMQYQRPEFRSQIKFKKTIDTNQIFLHKLFTRLKNGYSQLVIICGQQRIGKSFIAIWLAYLYMIIQNKPFDPKNHTFYDPIKSIEGLGGIDKEPLVVDEAGSLLTKREWYKKTHTALDRMIQTQGYKTMLFIFVSPFTSDIDKTFQKHFDFQLRVDGRGRYKAFQIFKKYDEFRQEKSTRRMFLDDVRLKITDIPKKIWDDYMEFSIKQKENMRLITLDEQKRNKKKVKKRDEWDILKEELGL